MSEILDELIKILNLQQTAANQFTGRIPKHSHKRVFGGQIATQALIAADRTVNEGRVHSLHSSFLRPRDINIPILFEVDRLRDGKSFTTRRVVAIQHGEPIFNLVCLVSPRRRRSSPSDPYARGSRSA